MAIETPPPARRPIPLTRAGDGRWIGGVCAGLARSRGLKISWVRAAFTAATTVGGLGALVYVACWLIIPAERDDAQDGARQRAPVVLAQACGGCVGLATLAAAGATATIFGFGWLVAALAAAILIAVLASWPRLAPGWALLPIAALTLPSVAVAADGLQLAPQAGRVLVSPRVITPATYRSGLGTMLIDLRHATLPASGEIPIAIDAGVRRTIVALPHGACVHVTVDSEIKPFLGRFAALLAGRQDRPFSDVVVFGNASSRSSGTIGNIGAPGFGPTINIHFRSLGGGLYVRDYPDGVDPELTPDWPGYTVYPELRPDTRGVPRRAARAMVAQSWTRRLAELRSAQLIGLLMPGPCGAVLP